MTKKATHYVVAYYDNSDCRFSQDDAILKVTGLPKDGAGTCLKSLKRDISFSVYSYKEGLKVAARCRRIKGVTAKVFRYDW